MLDSISFIVREADLSHQLIIVRYTILQKCLLTRSTSSLSLDEDILYIETQSLLFHCRHVHYTENAQWSQNGMTVAGGNGYGNALNQLDRPFGLDIDHLNERIVIADRWNHRIVEWKIDASNGKIIAGGQGQGNGLHQLRFPIDVFIDKETNNLFICDRHNRRVLRWSRSQGTTQGEVIVDNIDCIGLAIDHQRYFYVSDTEQDEVRRYTIGDKNGIVVAGGNGQGNQLNQLDVPAYLFVDEEQAVYVSDTDNHRVMKWNKGTNQGIVVAGRQGNGSALTQLFYPNGLFVDIIIRYNLFGRFVESSC